MSFRDKGLDFGDREIVQRQTITVWSRYSNNPAILDLTNTLYGGLSISPDSCIVKSVVYITGNEQNSSAVPVLTCNFINPNNSTNILAAISATGSINHPNTLFPVYFNGLIQPNNVQFELFSLTTAGALQPNILSKSTWMCTMEFIKYEELPRFNI